MSAEVLAPAPERLAALASIVEQEHALAEDAARTALGHAITAGEALREARELVQSGEWVRWLERRGIGEKRARDYIRIAAYQAELPEWVTNRSEAIVSLRGLPPASTGGQGWQRLPDETREEALRLRAEGLSQRQVGKALGISHVTVSLLERKTITEDERRKRRARQTARRRAAAEALKKVRRDREMKKYGGGVAEAYSLIRKAQQTLDRARSGAESAEMRHHLDQAIYGLNRAEEETARAVKIK